MSTRKSRSQSSVSFNANAARLAGGADPLPAAGAPTPPADQKALTRREAARTSHPQKAQLDIAPEAAREVRASTSFAEIIGSRIAPPGDLADAIDLASSWYREAKASDAWSAYAKAQSTIAWGGLLAVLAKVRAPLIAAQGADSALEKELHALTRLVTAKSDAAARAQVTRRHNEKTPKPAAVTPPRANAGGSAAAPTQAGAGSPPAVVILNGAHPPQGVNGG